MHIGGRLAVAVGSVMLLATAAFADTRADLGHAADRLALETRIAAAHGDTVSQSYLGDAQQLARSAERFRSDVETQTVSDERVNAAFQRVSAAYDRFRKQVKLANTQQAFGDLNAVTAPYEEVEHRLGINPGSPPPRD